MASSPSEAKIRQAWSNGSSVQIYSNSRKKWFQGEVAKIFHDAEGEWLEIRYDKSMSKQVQRYSTDIKPVASDLATIGKGKAQPQQQQQQPQPQTETDPSSVEATREVRSSWDRDDYVEIFSNTHKEWYLGQIVEITRDHEGEWLNCVWHRENGEAMSKQVQRYSTDVRPPQGDATETATTTKNRLSKKKRGSVVGANDMGLKDGFKSLREEIEARKNSFKRRAPLFSRTLRSSTFTYPATQQYRRSKKLPDIVEEDSEENDHMDKAVEVSTVDFSTWSAREVADWVASLGKEYQKYKKKFNFVSGSKLIKLTNDDLVRMEINKLHRYKLFLEVQRLSDKAFAQAIHECEPINWDVAQVKSWAFKKSTLNLYANKFFAHGINGLLLFELDNDDLDTIGVRPAHRKVVLDIIRDFESQKFPSLAVKKAAGDGGSEQRRKGGPLNAVIDELDDSKDDSLLNANSDDLMSGMGTNASVVTESDMRDTVDCINDIATLLVTITEHLPDAPKAKLTAQRLQSKLDRLLLKFGGSESDDTKLSETVHEGPHTKDVSVKDPMIEGIGTAVEGVEQDWIDTLEQKKGHKRRLSMPFNHLKQPDMQQEVDDQHSEAVEATVSHEDETAEQSPDEPLSDID